MSLATLSDDHAAIGSVVVLFAACCAAKAASALGVGEGGAEKAEKGKQLVLQAVRWASQSSQDSNPIFQQRHANYAVAYLASARSILPDAALSQAAGVDVHELASKLASLQQKTAAKLGKACPKTLPKGTSLSHWA